MVRRQRLPVAVSAAILAIIAINGLPAHRGVAAETSADVSPSRAVGDGFSFPGVKGDGVHDDTEAIQAALDTRRGLVYLPTPSAHYVISKTLVIHSGQTLRLDRSAVIRLADHADSLMLMNASGESCRGISVEGGIWDGNNANQTPHDFSPQVAYDPNRYLGVLMRFDGVRNLRIANLTLKDPESFAVQMGNIEQFTVENIDFDYNMLRLNMDGIHLNGNCRHGRIANLKGATNDDMVALNADDGGIAEMARGPISDVQVDGLFCENGYTAVRLLSAGSPVSRVRLSNIFGTYRYNVVSFTHHNVHPGAPTRFEDIVIDGVFCSKPTAPLPTPLPSDESARASAPLLWIAPGALVKSVFINNLTRTESASPTPDTIVVDAGATVENMAINNASLINKGPSDPSLLRNNGTIRVLSMTNVYGAAEDEPPRGFILRNEGTIEAKRLSNIATRGMNESN